MVPRERLDPVVTPANGSADGEPSPHRVIELPLNNVTLEFAHDGLLWAKNRIGPLLVGVDLKTGETRHRWQIEADINRQERLLHAGQYVAGSHQGRVRCLNLANGAETWTADGQVLGATENAFLLARHYQQEVVELQAETGKELRVLGLPKTNSRDWLDALSWQDSVLLADDHGVMLFPKGASRPRWTVKHGGSYPSLTTVANRPCLVKDYDTRHGAKTGLLEINLADGVLTETVTLEGRAHVAPTSGQLVCAMSRCTNEQRVFLARSIELPAQLTVHVHGFAECKASRNTGVGVMPGAVSVFRLVGGELGCFRTSLPEGSAPSACFADGLLCISVNNKLLLINVGSLSFEPGFNQGDLAFMAIGGGRGSSIPGRVVFAGPSMAMLDHPEYGRIKLDLGAGSVTLKSGDEVILDDVREKLKGIHEVKAWHKSGEAATAVPEAIPLVLKAIDLPPRDMPVEHTKLENAVHLRSLSARLKFRTTPLFEKVISLNDSDPRFQEWLERQGFIVQVEELSQAWMGADPCLIPIVSNGGGDLDALYFYPPAFHEGEGLPVARWCHDSNEVEWLAGGFDEYFANQLDKWGEEAAISRKLVMEALGLDDSILNKPAQSEPPPWFSAAHGREKEPALTKVIRAAKTDPMGAERDLVALYARPRSEDGELLKVFKAMEKIYAALGWAFHLENLRHMNEYKES